MLQQERLAEERIPHQEARRARDPAHYRGACTILVRETWLAFGASPVTGLELVSSLAAGNPMPMASHFSFRIKSVVRGDVVALATPSAEHYNPFGVAQGGFAGTVLDMTLGLVSISVLEEGASVATNAHGGGDDTPRRPAGRDRGSSPFRRRRQVVRGSAFHEHHYAV